VFRGATDDSARVDVYVKIPYQTLNFTRVDEFYTAKFQVVIAIYDSLGNRFGGTTYSKSLLETDYSVSQGGTGKFDLRQIKLNLPVGNFRLKATLIDEFSRSEYSQSRSISVIDFPKYNVSMSALMIISSIEETGGRYSITPHLSDNIGNLREGFFIFFEVYNNGENTDSDIIYQIYENDNLISSGTRNRKSLINGRNQIYLRIEKPTSMKQSSYLLRVLALKPSELNDYELDDIIAVSQRSIKSISRFGGLVLADLNKAIRQLRYVANQKDIDLIQSALTDDEKMNRFEAFWKELDPTPTTERNEAFDEYYRRIDITNKNFRSYTEGWMTDKGMVFIIFGPPQSVERTSPYGDGRIYERWSYFNNREFLFVDNSGFGDFRLVRPVSVVEKYKFER